jgi:hypothetical protein
MNYQIIDALDRGTTVDVIDKRQVEIAPMYEIRKFGSHTTGSGSFCEESKKEAPFPTPPVLFELTIHEPEWRSPRIVPFYGGQEPLFRDDLIEAVLAAGVDNLQFFDALIVHPETGREFTNFKLVNIVGNIDIFDKKKTKMMGIGDDVFPDHVEDAHFDGELADGTLMFRLPGSAGIAVHEKVRKFIEDYKIPDMTYYEDIEWMG